ncbi:MAG: ATP-binding cassette domain-containing protein, partial [Acidocella sp.]|nr:ATP-binding cassette domain-containing protein [Acidocella sp.]
MSAKAKPWVKAEQKLGFRAARISIALGAVQVALGIAQAGCAALLLAGVLHLAAGGAWALLYGAGFALAAFARAYVQMQAERRNFELGAAARRRLRGNVLSVLMALGPVGLRGTHSGDLAVTAVDRVEAMDGFHSRWVPATALAVIGPALVGVVALFMDWRSGLVLLLAGLFVPFAMAVAGIGAGVAAKKQFVAMTRLQIRFLDRIRGISTIVLAGRAADETRALAAAAKELRVRTMRVLRVAFLSSTSLDLAAAAALIIIVLRFAPVLHGHTALAPVALFMVLLVPEFFAPLRGFSAVYADRMAVEAVADEFAGLPEAPPTVPAAEIRSVAAHGVTLAFEHVSFAWGEDRAPVLENLSFNIGRGEILLLTGASGMGKSTIMDLILGFLAPQAGRITINGAELEALVPAARINMLGWIGQKPVIFAGTIEENIRFARPSASETELAD